MNNALGFSSIIAGAVDIFLKKFWKMIGIIALGLLVSVPLFAALYFAPNLAQSAPLLFILLTPAVFAVIAILFVCLRQAMYAVAIKDISVLNAVLLSLRNWWPIVVTYVFLLTVIYGGMFLFIPGIIYAVWFAFTPLVLASGEATGMDAMIKSRSYVVGRWWIVFGYFLLLFAAIFALMFISGLLAEKIGPLVAAPVSVLVALLLYTFPLSFTAALYRALSSTAPTSSSS